MYNYTAKKAGNALILDWNIFCETYDNVVYVVTRTPLSGTGSGTPVALPNSVDSANNTWSGVSVHTYDNNNYDTPQNNLIRITLMAGVKKNHPFKFIFCLSKAL